MSVLGRYLLRGLRRVHRGLLYYSIGIHSEGYRLYLVLSLSRFDSSATQDMVLRAGREIFPDWVKKERFWVGLDFCWAVHRLQDFLHWFLHSIFGELSGWEPSVTLHWKEISCLICNI